ncbi:MAG: hypothetical protein EPN88_10880 [Bacteroidetes bacterium]|nr:MAG: hypothetical protein EPN88_10880 [Bacteroidota bacterium]
MQHKYLTVIFISFFSAFAFTASGQKLVNSPYSRFNLGTMEPAGSFKSLGMGGIGIALRDNSTIYFSNPASFSSLDTNSFIFDFGIDYSKNILSDRVSKFSSDDINFDHLLIGFPLAKGWGVAAGFVPMSNGYYKMAESVLKTDPGYDPIVGEYTTSHTGDGGFNNFFLGSGLKLNKNFSIGANMTMLLGQVNRLNKFNFLDYYNVFHNSTTEKLQLSGINFEYGVQYTASLKNDYFFNIGVAVNSGNNYKSTFDHLSYKYNAFGTRDTISNIADDTTKAFIPGTLKMGIAFGKVNKFTAGFDFITTRWSKAKIPGSKDYAADTKSFLFGLQYIPDAYSNYSFMKRIEYRVGGHVGDNYLIINGEQVKEYGASIGIGLRMRRTLSKANLFFDYTKKTGSVANGLHTEDYYTMGISLNLYDLWFVKRKYD